MRGTPGGVVANEHVRSTARAARAAPLFAWNDGRRFVEVFSVQTGWLVMWGSRSETGRRVALGNHMYRDLAGVRRRIAAAVFELTADRSAAAAAVVQLDGERLAHQARAEP